MEHLGLYLKDIFLNKRGGSLIFRRETISKYLFFKEGYLIFAKSNHPNELLGEILFRLGKIPEEVHARIDEYIIPKKRIGEVLIENNLITKDDLKDGLSYQMKEIVLNMFPHFDAEIKFHEKEEFVAEDFEFKVNISFLIEDGIRRMKYDPALRDFLAPGPLSPKSRDLFYRLTEDEKEIFEAITENTRAEAILEAKEFYPELYWKSLYLFYCLDLIDVETDETARTEPGRPKESKIGVADQNLAEALEMSENLERKDYYQILEVPQDADSTEIKKSYFRLARKFHPDMFDQNLPHEIRVTVEEVFDRITKAYQILIDEQKRKDYDKTLRLPKEDSQKEWLRQAGLNYERAKTLYSQGQYDESRILLEEAVRLNANKGSYFLLLAMAEARIPQYRRKAEANFIRATKLEPWNAKAYIGLGLLYKDEGLRVKAEKQFRRALKFDPDNEVALRELKMTRKGPQKRSLKDLLTGDIFGRKK